MTFRHRSTEVLYEKEVGTVIAPTSGCSADHVTRFCVPGRPNGVGGEGTRNSDGQLMWTDPMQSGGLYSSNGWTADELNNLSDRRDNNIIVHSSRPQLEVVAFRPVVLWTGCG